MEFYETTETSSENYLMHTWKAADGDLHSICVDKNVSIDDAYIQMIDGAP